MNNDSKTNATLEHILRAARTARFDGPGVLSVGEKLGAAMVLNRADWIAEMDYTLADAIDRAGIGWLQYIPQAARILRDEP